MPAQLKTRLPSVTVNLLPQDQFMESWLGKLLTWSLSVGRYIVILTELIVILTFLSRFKLDRDLTDLNEAILQQKAVIETYGDTEAQYLGLVGQADFLTGKEQNLVIIPTLNTLEKLLPIDVRIVNLTLQPTSWSLAGEALSAQGMKHAIDQIVTINPQSDVSVGLVELDSRANVIKFEVRVAERIKQKPKKTNEAPVREEEGI